MPLENVQSLMRSLLVLVRDGKWHPAAEIDSALATRFRLGPAGDGHELLAFALNHLCRARLIECSAGTSYRVTLRGLDSLTAGGRPRSWS